MKINRNGSSIVGLAERLLKWCGNLIYRLPITDTARRIVILTIGALVLFIGVALIFLPGPAIVVIPAGLAILATEFQWARNLLNKGKSSMRRMLSRP